MSTHESAKFQIIMKYSFASQFIWSMNLHKMIGWNFFSQLHATEKKTASDMPIGCPKNLEIGLQQINISYSVTKSSPTETRLPFSNKLLLPLDIAFHQFCSMGGTCSWKFSLQSNGQLCSGHLMTLALTGQFGGHESLLHNVSRQTHAQTSIIGLKDLHDL